LQINKNKNNKRIIIVTLKIIISVGLIIILLVKTNLYEIYLSFIHSNLLYLLLAILTPFISVALRAHKWQCLLNVLDVQSKFSTLTKLYLIGMFYNNFFPTTIGGDVAKIYLTSKVYKNPDKIMWSILIDRFTGMTSLNLATLLLLVFFRSYLYMKEYKIWIVILAVLNVILIFSLLWGDIFFNYIIKFSFFHRKSWLHELIQRQAMLLSLYRKKHLIFLYAIFLGIIFYLLIGVQVYFGCLALNISAPIGKIILIVFLVAYITIIPVSFNGIGVLESGYAFFFSKIGVSISVGFAIGLISRLSLILMSLIGGLINLLPLKCDKTIKEE